ncbi:MAG: hypothetical protein JEY94_07240 [Melioribacteraceae bacterium]|nr:hypothetical protein [Melioribacteraceae bacterium]
MPNKKYFIASITLLVLSVTGTFFFAVINSLLISNLCLLMLIAGAVMLIHWSTISYNWKCTKCSNIIELSMWQNIKGMNIGINEKYLFCPACNKKVPFKGIPK